MITQNIDGLHTAAGSKNVFELHGSVYRNRCLKCGRFFGLDAITGCSGVPKCVCGGIIKPEVVLYGEQLESNTVNGAVRAISQSDMLIVAGTSLTVYPAAGFLNCFNGDSLVLINRDPTPYDGRANLVIREKVGETLWECVG